MAPRKRLREAPSTMGRPSATKRSRWRSRVRLCSTVLPKPMPGSSRICSSRTPCDEGEGQAFLQELEDLQDDILVARFLLHGLGLPLHVHEADGAACLGDDVRHVGVAAQGRDVIDDRRAGGQGAARHFRLRRVHADRHADALGQGLDHGHHAAQLLVRLDRVRARPRGLAADVDDGRALAHERQGLLEGGVGGEEAAAVRERIGRDVDDAHDAGERQVERPDRRGRHRRVSARG